MPGHESITSIALFHHPRFDYFVHFSMISLTLLIVHYTALSRPLSGMICAYFVNALYLKNCSPSQRDVFERINDMWDVAANAMLFPNQAFNQVAVLSYISMAKMITFLSAFALMHYRSNVVLLLWHKTGWSSSFALARFLEPSAEVLLSKVIFNSVSLTVRLFRLWTLYTEKETRRLRVHDTDTQSAITSMLGQSRVTVANFEAVLNDQSLHLARVDSQESVSPLERARHIGNSVSFERELRATLESQNDVH